MVWYSLSVSVVACHLKGKHNEHRNEQGFILASFPCSRALRRVFSSLVFPCVDFLFRDDHQSTLRQIVFGKLKLPDNIPEGARDILQHVLDKDPDRRWTLEKVKQHPWFRIDYEGKFFKRKC